MGSSIRQLRALILLPDGAITQRPVRWKIFRKDLLQNLSATMIVSIKLEFCAPYGSDWGGVRIRRFPSCVNIVPGRVTCAEKEYTYHGCMIHFLVHVIDVYRNIDICIYFKIFNACFVD